MIYLIRLTLYTLYTFTISGVLTINSIAAGFSSDDPFSLRFDAALSRYGNYGDVLGAGSASTGSTFSSSMNPASTVIRNKKEEIFTISPQQTDISFENGHDLDIVILGGTYRIDDQQKLEYGVASVDSSSDKRIGDPTDTEFSLEADIYTIGWATSLSKPGNCNKPSHFVGINYSQQDTESDLDFGFTSIQDSGESSSINIGYLYHTMCDLEAKRNNLALGVTLTLGNGDSTRTSLISPADSSESSNKALRAGVGYRVSEGRYLYSDLQYGEYANTDIGNNTETIDVARLFAGIQWQIPANPGDGFRLYLRSGFVLDDEGNKSQTLGIGTVLAKKPSYQIGVDIGYQRNMFPEIEPEFGDSDLYNISFRVKFKT